MASPAGGAPIAATAAGREVEELMRRHNPAFIPRNHLVEEALAAATGEHDYHVMERLLDVLSTPYDHDRDLPAFSLPAPTAGPTARSAGRNLPRRSCSEGGRDGVLRGAAF